VVASASGVECFSTVEEDVLNSLSQIAGKFRTRVGESLAANLGLVYSGVGESVLSAESTTKAWQLRDRVSDREKFFITFTYDQQVTGNLEKAFQTLELWAQTFPRGEEPAPQDLLAGLSAVGTGRFERAIQQAKKGIRGEAFVAERRYAEAIVEFQKILDHRGIVVSDPIGALAHLQLGRAYALSGDKAKAKNAYQDFLTLWKDADPDIPILKQAKAEYAKLP
jgi:tetratricopeptide (TPR) repeat protein